MITCPWCGTSYAAFQSNCDKCGGTLPPQAEAATAGAKGAAAPKPPPAPRTIADKFAWSLMSTDAWAITAGVFALLGGTFTITGLIMTIIIVTAFVGLPFLIFGLIFLGFGLAGLAWRHQQAQQIINVLRHGEPAEGQIVWVKQNMTVRSGRQRPWIIGYKFRVNGQDYEGNVSTFNQKHNLQPGQAVCVLFLAHEPKYNALYPHP